ncbi:MAG TPA: hypothetical protein VG755_10745 [Nannocystaceae bacterium]|nr:hypothetical protein [Nannocystaceae bacterium]
MPERGPRLRYVLALVPLLSACLSAFAPPLFARREHASMRKTSPSSECLSCHPVETEAHEVGSHAVAKHEAPIVARWMIEAQRGCLTCHAVLGTR